MKILWMASSMILAVAALATAQEAGSPTVTVKATGKVAKAATALQFTFQLSAKGDDVAKAAESLETKQKAAVELLKTLGVTEKDIVITPPSLEKKDPNMVRMMRQARPSNRLKKKKDDDKPEKEQVVVIVSLTARLPLLSKTPAALFVESEALKEKVKSGKLIEKDKKEAGEGDEEEAMNARMQYQEQQGLEDGFLFVFYAPSEPKDVDAALAKAMEGANSLAQSGARASGRTLGGTKNVEISESDGSMSQGRNYYYQQRRGGTVSSSSDGLVSMTLDGLEVEMTLTVTFGLK